MTPSLPGLFNTAPYLHDGSAPSLEDVFSSVGGEVIQAESATLSGTATITVPGDFSYLRQGAGVVMGSDGALAVSAGSSLSRVGFVRVRYGSVTGNSQLVLSVNGRQYSAPLETLPMVDGEHVAFSEVIFRVQFDRGNNTLVVKPLSGVPGATVLLDDLTISTRENEELAKVHTVFHQIHGRKQSYLLDYLLQLDRGPNSSGGASKGGRGK
jgi:hypothetical protein